MGSFIAIHSEQFGINGNKTSHFGTCSTEKCVSRHGNYGLSVESDWRASKWNLGTGFERTLGRAQCLAELLQCGQKKL